MFVRSREVSGMSKGGIERWTNDIHQGDAREKLREMPESSVHSVVTSPPYFDQRDYGTNGQIGLEDSVEEYIEELLTVGEEIRRVLREDGSWWLNIGDTFKQKSKLLVPHRVAAALSDAGWYIRQDNVWAKTDPIPNPVKDRHAETKEFVFHLTAAPTYWFDLDAVRVDPKDESLERAAREYNGSKQSDTDRYPDRDGESRLHNFDRPIRPNGKNPGDIWEFSTCNFPDAHFAVFPPALPEPAIKASCPPKVCPNCGTPYERDVEEVPVWERDRSTIEREQLQVALDRFDESELTEEHLKAARAKGFSDAAHGKQQSGAGRNTDRVEKLAEEAKDVLGGYFREMTMTARETGDWQQVCDCDADRHEAGIVLDPFAGAGTTALVAKKLGRRFVGIDLNPDYVAMAQHRVGLTVDEPDRLDLLEDDAQTFLVPATDGGNRRDVQPGTDRSDGGDE
jgi:DNA modification methylase